MPDEMLEHLPPLQGCLYCHSEGTTYLTEGWKFLGFGPDYPVLKCSQCHAVAWLDVGVGGEDNWRIRYRRVNSAPRFFYVAQHLGGAGWLSAQRALAISTESYVQRRRVHQAKEGNLDWLQPAPLRPPPPLMRPEEKVYLTLRAVSLQSTPPSGFLMRFNQGGILDSGKLYVTDQKLHLLGQRRDWSHLLQDVEQVEYKRNAWMIYLIDRGQAQHYHGAALDGQPDPQIIATVIEALQRWMALRAN